jgi:hypothetical protein
VTTITQRILQLTALLIIGSLQFGASCASTGPYDSDQDRDDRYPPEVDRPNRIPRWSDLVCDGDGKQKWTADMTGDIYVYDVRDDRIVWTGPIKRDQQIIVEPNHDRISIDERPVYTENLRRDARHQVYFARMRQGGNSDRDRDQNRDRGNNRDNTNDLPRDAKRLARGTGDLAIHATPTDGIVYVFDEDDGRVLYTQDLKRGSSFQIFPGKDYVNVNSKRSASVRLADRHQYGLYFRER